VTTLGNCYKQLNSSVGQFGTATLQAATTAIESNSPGDQTYLTTDQVLSSLETVRDNLAGVIKGQLEAAEYQGSRVFGVTAEVAACHGLISEAQFLAAHGAASWHKAYALKLRSMARWVRKESGTARS